MTEITLFKGGYDPEADAGVIHYPETGQSLRWVRMAGLVWLHFGDLCKGTGHTNPSAAIHLVEDEDKRKLDVTEVFAGQMALRNLRAGTTSGNAEAWFVNEDGFMTIGLAGRGDGPRMFRRWVVKVVIRQFRNAQGAEMAKKPGSDLDLIQGMLDAIRADRERLTAIEAKVAAIEGAHDWFTALGFAKLHGHPTGRPHLSKVGKLATGLMRDQGREPQRRQDATFGAINVYPADVLEQAFETVRA